MFPLVTWRWTVCGLILGFVFLLVTWRLAVCGFIIDFSVCVGEMEIDRMWIDS